MSAQDAAATPRRTWRSIGAVFAGFLAVVVLSLGTDIVLHALKVYPPWEQGLHDPVLNVLALSYRIAYTVFGGWLTARLAPHAPMRHVWIYGCIGLAIGTVGVIVTLPLHLGPAWYPILIAVTAVPCAWLGGKLQARQ
ncbi:MAG: hypothetical protein HY255_00125 [Betaproteobacteria bacterium]|nr:hypothetical protein [Betaproteobacteria bacterium]